MTTLLATIVLDEELPDATVEKVDENVAAMAITRLHLQQARPCDE